MRVRLARRDEDDATVTLVARATFGAGALRLGYRTRTGALLRIDGHTAGAFDGKHPTIDLTPRPGDHELELIVDKRSLPTSQLPDRDGPLWRWLLARAAQTPHDELSVDGAPAAYGLREPLAREAIPLVGHAHLDVAWLWTYADTRRKALRTFATALRQLELDDRYVFTQSQPQLYAWVAAADPELFARIRARVGRGWDASTASMWVEPDLHAPSGESVLRQFLAAARYTQEQLDVVPDVVWLPDTFGFPSTLPTLAVHAGMRFFATTKLQWNETTRWPDPQFHWCGDDGSQLLAAVIDKYDGPPSASRKRIAADRRELLVHGYGDGGGGATDAQLAGEGRHTRPWTSVRDWFLTLGDRTLPRYEGELYLETHRGTYTTHHDVKARNAALERELGAAEELVAWCAAVRAAPGVVRPLAEDLRNAWTIVLRAQFHDVIAGTSLGAVYADVHAEYDRAEAIVARVTASARALLPRADVAIVEPPPVVPRLDGDAYAFENAYVSARVRRDGTVVELRASGGPNVVALANGLSCYVDRPRAWDAWNLDAGYDRRRRRVRPHAARIEDGALVVELDADGSAVAQRIRLLAGEPYLRVEPVVRWNARHRVLRADHRFAIRTDGVRFGQPHGTLRRPSAPQTPAERARFEVPGQRWVHAADDAHGCAIFVSDIYGWNLAALPGGAVRVGMSLLRAPCWPDPGADRGEHRFAYALAPTAGATIGGLESAWQDYAEPERVRLFLTDDPGVLIVAVKPADDGDGVIVRVRECDGQTRRVTLRCAGRMTAVSPTDGCERPVAGAVERDGETFAFVLPAFALRTFRVLS